MTAIVPSLPFGKQIDVRQDPVSWFDMMLMTLASAGLSIRVDVAGAFVTLSAALFVLYAKSMDAALAGFVLSLAMSFVSFSFQCSSPAPYAHTSRRWPVFFGSFDCGAWLISTSTQWRGSKNVGVLLLDFALDANTTWFM